MSVTVNGSNGITFNDGSSQTAAASPFGLKNRIINGDMRIDQRNSGSAVTADGAFPLDRWKIILGGGGALSAQRSTTAPAGYTNSLYITATTADTSLGTSDEYSFRHAIEGFNVADLGWGTANAQTITLSFKVRSSVTGTYGGVLRNSAADRLYVFSYTVNSANTWEDQSVTIAGDTSGTWLTDNGIGIQLIFSLGAGSSRLASAGSWGTTGNIQGVTGQTQWISTLNATFYITGVQLEVGSTATPFERRMYTNELQLCQRYYVKYAFPVDTGAGASPLGTAVSPTLADGYIIPCVPFRVSATNLSLTVSSLQIYTVSSSGVFSTGTWAIPYDTNSLLIPIRYTHGSSVFTSGASQLIVGNGTTGFLALSAEL